jgi:hypothetical protein
MSELAIFAPVDEDRRIDSRFRELILKNAIRIPPV